VATGPATVPAITQAAGLIRQNLSQAIYAGRSLARSKGHDSIKKELELIAEFAPPLGGELKRIRGAPALDMQRANYVASRFSDYWAESALKAVADGKSASSAAVEANKKQEFRVKMVAVTEAANAWNDERQSEIVQLAQEEPLEHALSGLAVFNEWDAAADRRTCDVCESQHGKIRPIGISFGVGDPPTHPNCRCGLMLVVLPVYYEWQEEEAA
tara:strand:- start:57 stop:698 length:642 start_codon:yes stop_codon:yes gene_type:complete